MKRSAEFDITVKRGVRAARSDLVVYLRREDGCGAEAGPRVGLIIAKSVGSAVERHQVARRLRHVVRALLSDLDPLDRVVIRALPGSRRVSSAWLEQQLRSALRRVSAITETAR